MNAERFKRVMGFLFMWLLAWIVWSFSIRAFLAHHADNPAAQGLALDTVA